MPARLSGSARPRAPLSPSATAISATPPTSVHVRRRHGRFSGVAPFFFAARMTFSCAPAFTSAAASEKEPSVSAAMTC